MYVAEFLLNVRGLFYIFSTTTQGIRLRRRVDAFSTTSYTILSIFASKLRQTETSLIDTAQECKQIT